MKDYRLIAILLGSSLLAACGGDDNIVVECDGGEKYQNRVEGKRVEVPEGLDALNEFAEMPIPRADPNAAKIVEGRCVDMPPPISRGS